MIGANALSQPTNERVIFTHEWFRWKLSLSGKIFAPTPISLGSG
jgi:hypothetical protein